MCKLIAKILNSICAIIQGENFTNQLKKDYMKIGEEYKKFEIDYISSVLNTS